jgi:poly-gamma-glutamate synthesis protein (capsule biosynthesis protein)
MAQINALCITIADDKALAANFVRFQLKVRKMYLSFLEPHDNGYLSALQNKRLFPSLLMKKKKRLLLNLTRCESHREVLLSLLKEL